MLKKFLTKKGHEVYTAAKETTDLGTFDYITKPFSLEYLQDVLMVKLLYMTDEI